MRGESFILALFCLILFVLTIITILTIRSTWDNVNTRERGMIFLYITAGVAFVVALYAFIIAEQTPNVCVLPYSKKLALYN